MYGKLCIIKQMFVGTINVASKYISEVENGHIDWRKILLYMSLLGRFVGDVWFQGFAKELSDLKFIEGNINAIKKFFHLKFEEDMLHILTYRFIIDY